jgi:hypothetical protein
MHNKQLRQWATTKAAQGLLGLHPETKNPVAQPQQQTAAVRDPAALLHCSYAESILHCCCTLLHLSSNPVALLHCSFCTVVALWHNCLVAQLKLCCQGAAESLQGTALPRAYGAKVPCILWVTHQVCCHQATLNIHDACSNSLEHAAAARVWQRQQQQVQQQDGHRTIPASGTLQAAEACVLCFASSPATHAEKQSPVNTSEVRTNVVCEQYCSP